MDGLVLCGWPVASALPEHLGCIQVLVDAHPDGGAVVSSCQRIEVFLFDGGHSCGAPLRWTGFEALLHVASVAAGLESIVLGEEQVLGQVRQAIASASAGLGMLGGLAIAAARQLRAEAQFESDTGHLLDRALSTAGATPSGHAVVVGAGAVGRLVALRALAIGFDEVSIAARSRPEGAWFDDCRLRFLPFETLGELPSADVVVTCLGAPAPQLTPADLPRAVRLIVDLGTPRNTAGEDGVRVVNVAGLASEPPASAARREQLGRRLREILVHRLESAQTDTSTTIGRFRQEIERIREAEAGKIRRLHPELSAEAVEAITRSMVNQLFHRATSRLKAVEDGEFHKRFAALFAGAPADEAVR